VAMSAIALVGTSVIPESGKSAGRPLPSVRARGPIHRLRCSYFFAGGALLLAAFICCPQQISEWGMLSGHGHAFS